MATLTADELRELCVEAITRAGAGESDARILGDAVVEAEQAGHRTVGLGHLFDYLDGYRAGRISASRPVVRHAASAVVDVDAHAGLAQSAFHAAVDDLERAARAAGIAALWIRNSYTCGELGYYPRHLAKNGFVAVAMANSPALMSLGGAPSPVLGTNPLAYAVPRSGRPPLVVDQASSSTAFVNVRRAAESHEPIPAGWALGPDGRPTRDAEAALRGTLLPFGGHRGGNIALLVEVLSTLSGANFSLDAAPFDGGEVSPGIGVFVLAIDSGMFPGSTERLIDLLGVLKTDHRVRLPFADAKGIPDMLDIDDHLLTELQR